MNGPEKKGGKIPVIHTMKSDTAKYIKEKGVSLVDIASAEAKRGRLRKTAKKPNNLLLIAALSVFMVSLAVFASVFFTAREKAEKQALEAKLPAPLIASDRQQKIIVKEAEKEIDLKKLSQTISTGVALGELVDFVFVDENNNPLSAGLFLKKTGIDAPLGLTNFLEKRFMFGVYAGKRNWPFLVLKTRSYEHLFAVMLKREPFLRDSLKPLFLLPPISATNAFHDQVIKNQDVRILEEGEENALLYSFIDKETLVISPNKKVFEEILRRRGFAR
jgi:hypothetical protein